MPRRGRTARLLRGRGPGREPPRHVVHARRRPARDVVLPGRLRRSGSRAEGGAPVEGRARRGRPADVLGVRRRLEPGGRAHRGLSARVATRRAPPRGPRPGRGRDRAERLRRDAPRPRPVRLGRRGCALVRRPSAGGPREAALRWRSRPRRDDGDRRARAGSRRRRRGRRSPRAGAPALARRDPLPARRGRCRAARRLRARPRPPRRDRALLHEGRSRRPLPRPRSLRLLARSLAVEGHRGSARAPARRAARRSLTLACVSAPLLRQQVEQHAARRDEHVDLRARVVVRACGVGDVGRDVRGHAGAQRCASHRRSRTRTRPRARTSPAPPRGHGGGRRYRARTRRS